MPRRHQEMASVGQYTPLHINALSLPVNTTSATTITAGNGVVVTPASMANIFVGTQLFFTGGVGSAETVVVTAVTGSTFTANFVNGHSGAYTITTPTAMIYIPVGNCVNTSSATAITAGSNVTVTPASMNGITIGQKLDFANGTGAAELVVVKQVNIAAGTFVADFVNNHSGNYTIASVSGTFLGRVVVGAAGSGMTLTLYNGNPNVVPLPAKSGVITALTPVAGQPYIFDLACDYGLFYTYAGTTPGDVTIGYTDMPLS